MTKSTFYSSIAVLVIVDILQSGSNEKLSVQRGQPKLGDGSAS